MRLKVRSKTTEVTLPETVGADEFENCLSVAKLRVDLRGHFVFDLSLVQFAPLETLVTLLCIMNRLASEGSEVVMYWSDEQVSFGYAERMGFFELLHENIAVVPSRPEHHSTSFHTHKNRNPLLLEMTQLPVDDLKAADRALERLVERLEENLSGLADVEEVANRIWTCASETVSNIHEHSESPVPGIIAVQRYSSRQGNGRLQLVIADAGLGLTATIRRGNPGAVGSRPDSKIILAAFRDGLSSRLEPGRGCGLTRCANLAAMFSGNLRVRTGATWAKLVTKSKKGWTVGIYDDEAVALPGTHVVFDFYLDRVVAAANLIH